MRREGILREEARRILVKETQSAAKWSCTYMALTHGIRCSDLVIHIDNLGVEDAVGMCCKTLSAPCFKTTAHSQRLSNDLA